MIVYGKHEQISDFNKNYSLEVIVNKKEPAILKFLAELRVLIQFFLYLLNATVITPLRFFAIPQPRSVSTRSTDHNQRKYKFQKLLDRMPRRLAVLLT